MKKIGIMTLYYKNHNNGGQLQAYALCKFLNMQTGIQSEQICFDYKKKKKKLKWKKLCFRVYSVLFHPVVMSRLNIRKKKFKDFELQIPHSEVVDETSIGKVAQQYDYVMVGSDQVWNFEYSSECFLLKFLDPKKRCAYAASFGKDCLDNDSKYDVVQALKSFSFLTVREDNAKKFLNKNGITGAEVVCDPTLLLTKDEWEKNIPLSKKIIQGEYLFVYLLGASSEIRKEIKIKAQERGLKIVFLPHIHFSYQKRDRGFADINVYDVGPWEFLQLIHEATAVITDSFHCSLFAIMFKKDFWTLQRENNNITTTSSRMKTLLNKAGLMNRFANSAEEINLKSPIIYSSVNDKLDGYIKYSRQLLLEFIKEDNSDNVI